MVNIREYNMNGTLILGYLLQVSEGKQVVNINQIVKRVQSRNLWLDIVRMVGYTKIIGVVCVDLQIWKLM